MEINITFDSYDNAQQLRALAKFAKSLAKANSLSFMAPTDDAELKEPEAQGEINAALDKDDKKEAKIVRRKRRTKAEIEADRIAEEAAVAAEDEAHADNEAALREIERDDEIASNDPDPDATQMLNRGDLAAARAEALKEIEKADEPDDPEAYEQEEALNPDKGVTGPYWHTKDDVLHNATLVAKKHGPDIVKDKIAELGATRVAAMDQDQLNALGAFLESKL